MHEKPTPVIYPDSQKFWEACNEERLLYQQCDDCAQVQSFPRSYCAHCHGTALTWHESTRRGKIASFTVVHRGPSAAFKEDEPYLIVLVDMDEGFRLMMNLRESNPDQAKIGAPVQIIFEPSGNNEQKLPQATLAE